MYTLYHLPGSCSLVTLTLLLQMDQPVKLIHRDSVAEFHKINPVGAVPALTNSHGKLFLEGGAIVTYLYEQHDARWQQMTEIERHAQLQDVFFANATVHPAYNRLFFIQRVLLEESARETALQAAADAINSLWQVVESRLIAQPFLGGKQPSPADIMLTVYSRWGARFAVTIEIGPRCQQLIKRVTALAAFNQALEMEAGLQL